MPAWEALGFTQSVMDAVARNMAASFSWWSGPPTGADADLDLWASDAAREGMAVFAMGSMGYYVPGLPAEDWRDVGRKLVEAMTYFFFGPWRDRFTYLGEQFNRERARAELPWIGCYREGLAVALSLGDWASADRLLEWPDSDLRFDEGSDDRTREDNAYQIWLALRLRGEQGNRVSAQRDVANRQLRREGDLSAAKALRQVKTLLPNTTRFQRPCSSGRRSRGAHGGAPRCSWPLPKHCSQAIRSR